MDIQELVNGLKEKGLQEEEIKNELLKIKADIDAYLGEEKAPVVEEEKETEEQKEERVFGA